jgi:hypothetical protein
MKIKTYPKYKKKKDTPKAFVGAATAALGLGKAIYGGIQARKAKKAEQAFDKSRLEGKVSAATQQMADEPIDQSYIENLQQQQAADRASAMGALSKDPRNVLAGVQALENQAARQRTSLLGMQDEAKRRAMTNLAQEQRAVESQRVNVASQELAGIRGQRAAAEQNIFGGLEDIASGTGEIFAQKDKIGKYDPDAKITINKEGGKIEAEEGGVTPGEFDHDSNPIDMVQDGEKIGEATGGELILPPDDVEAIRSSLKEGDKDAAFKLMEDLVAKYDENVMETNDDSGEAEEPKEETPVMKRGGYLERVKARMGAYMKNKY